MPDSIASSRLIGRITIDAETCHGTPCIRHLRYPVVMPLDHTKKHAIMPQDITMKPYGIPLRALLAKEVDGLMMAGRCISGDFIARSSYRVTSHAVGMRATP